MNSARSCFDGGWAAQGCVQCTGEAGEPGEDQRKTDRMMLSFMMSFVECEMDEAMPSSRSLGSNAVGATKQGGGDEDRVRPRASSIRSLGYRRLDTFTIRVNAAYS